MIPLNTRLWYQRHWFTLLAIGTVLWALIDRQMQDQNPYHLTDGTYTFDSHFGWPGEYLVIVETGITFPQPGDPPPVVRYYWNAWKLIGNCLAAALLLASTSSVCEHLMQTRRHLQFNLWLPFAVTTVVAVFCSLRYVAWNVPASIFDFLRNAWFYVSWSHFNRPVQYSVPLAICCAVYVLGCASLWSWQRAQCTLSSKSHQAAGAFTPCSPPSPPHDAGGGS